MRKLLYLFVMMLFVSCISQRVTVNTYGNGKYMTYAMDTMFAASGFANICEQESIPTVLKQWIGMGVVDYEGNEIVRKYMYIQKMDTTEVVYTLQVNEDIYKLRKRITSNTK